MERGTVSTTKLRNKLNTNVKGKTVRLLLCNDKYLFYCIAFCAPMLATDHKNSLIY